MKAELIAMQVKRKIESLDRVIDIMETEFADHMEAIESLYKEKEMLAADLQSAQRDIKLYKKGGWGWIRYEISQ